MIPEEALLARGVFRAHWVGRSGGMSVNFQFMSRDADALAEAQSRIEVGLGRVCVGVVKPSGYHNTPTWFVSKHSDCLALADALLGAADEGGPGDTEHPRAPVLFAWEHCLSLIGPDAAMIEDRGSLIQQRALAIQDFKRTLDRHPRRR